MAQDQPPAGAVQQQLFPPPPPYFSRLPEGAAPPPPPTGEYQLFGELHTSEDGQPPLHVRRLYALRPDGGVDLRAQLLALHRELAANFLELLAVLADRPSGYARQVEAVGLVLRNMQHLANQLRPPQAHAALSEALRAQAGEGRAAGEALTAAVARAEEAVGEAGRLLLQARAGAGDGEDGGAAAPPPAQDAAS
jgi:mediator of RNA polymerase II transcription subunit 7